MKFTLSNEVTRKVPDATVGVLVARNVDNTKSADGTYQNLWTQIEEAGQDLAAKNLDELDAVSTWQAAFSKVGINPRENDASHIALLKRVQNRQEIPNINSAVNILNAISIGHRLPIGAHDLDKISGDVTVGPNKEKLAFFPMNSEMNPMNSEKKEDVSPEEIVYADEENVHTRKWVWREGRKVMTTEETENIFIPFDSFTSLHKESDLKKIAQEIAARMRFFISTPATTFHFAAISEKHPSVDLDDLPKLTGIKKINIKTHTIKRDRKLINALTTRAVEQVYPSAEALEGMLLSGRRLNVYQGFDPTADTLHIGHTAGMRKLSYFQKLGHNVTFLIGDFTARVGDPTDKSSARVKQTKEEVEENFKLYKEQAASILDLDDKENPVTVLYNSSWLEQLDFSDILELTSTFTVQQMIKRDMFQRRLKEDRPIHIHEFMYPMMQAYDSFHMNIDVEVGGNDQTFNMLTGRDLMIAWRNKEKVVISNKLLADASGAKMSKTGGNMVELSESPENMYGKIMAFSDGMIIPAFELLTDIPMEEIGDMQRDLENDEVNPMDLKKKLALTITAEHKGDKAAQAAQKHFESVFQKKELTADSLDTVTAKADTVKIIQLLTDVTEFAESNSAAKRLIKQGAVSIDGKKVTDHNASISITPNGVTLKAGKQIIRILH